MYASYRTIILFAERYNCHACGKIEDKLWGMDSWRVKVEIENVELHTCPLNRKMKAKCKEQYKKLMS